MPLQGSNSLMKRWAIIKQMRMSEKSSSALLFKRLFIRKPSLTSHDRYDFSSSSINTIVAERLACAPMTNACSMSAVLLGPLINVPKP